MRRYHVVNHRVAQNRRYNPKKVKFSFADASDRNLPGVLILFGLKFHM